MDFVFTARVSRIAKLHEVMLSIDGEEVAVMPLSFEEWETLRAILLAGSSWFQDGEATVSIEDSSTMHAYTEGV